MAKVHALWTQYLLYKDFSPFQYCDLNCYLSKTLDLFSLVKGIFKYQLIS
jgi:hypothetical protein